MAFVLLFDWQMERSGGADENDDFARWNWAERVASQGLPTWHSAGNRGWFTITRCPRPP